MLMMVWWNVWIYCNLNLCVAVVELGPKSSAVQTSHRFDYIQGGTLLQRFSIFGKNIQFSTYRILVCNRTTCICHQLEWLFNFRSLDFESGIMSLEWNTLGDWLLWYCPTKCDGGDFAQMFGLLTHCCVTGWVRARVDHPITLPAMRQSITVV